MEMMNCEYPSSPLSSWLTAEASNVQAFAEVRTKGKDGLSLSLR